MHHALTIPGHRIAATAGLIIVLGSVGLFAAPVRADTDPLSQLIEQLDPAPGRLESAPVVMLSRQAEARLLTAIEAFQAIRATGAWPTVPPGPSLALGDMSPSVPLIRQRLVGDGTLTTGNDDANPLFDWRLDNQVRRFQQRYGIEVDGVVGPLTRAAMNVPIGTRLAQLRANLDRLRDARARISTARHVLVNLSAFRLQAVTDERVDLQSRVIVGRPDRPTPLLRASIIAVDFLPAWHVPPGIARNDLFPRLRTDPGYFVRHDITITRVSDGQTIDPRLILLEGLTADKIRFRQAPGPGNALGLIRLNMPNEHIVYLHDTPDRSRYEAASRAFSSGCVRVEQIVSLTRWILDDDGQWTDATIEQVLARGRSFTVALPRSVPVHLINLTAWAEAGGVAHFRPDLYGIDRRLGEPATPPSSAPPEPLITP